MCFSTFLKLILTQRVVGPFSLSSLSFISFIFIAVFEGLHKYGFRNGLCNSLYSPSFNVNKLTESDVSATVLMMTIMNLILADGVCE